MLEVVDEENETDAGVPAVGGSLLDQLVRDGARAMLAAALQAEVTHHRIAPGAPPYLLAQGTDEGHLPVLQV